MKKEWEELTNRIHGCRKCPRLVDYRENVPVRTLFTGQTYWRKPISGFGDPNAWLLILGLAPSPQGGNRTGRIFTGDLSARFLFSCLHQAGLANQPFSESRDDGLIMLGSYMTAAVKCTPPKHHPTPQEFQNCQGYLLEELVLLKHLKAVLALGQLAFKAYLHYAKLQGHPTAKITFSHSCRYDFEGIPTLYGSYHPSPQNTQTGKMSSKMFIELLEQIKKDNC